MKIGIIGCGVICKVYIKEIKRVYARLIEIVAVADLNQEAAKQMAAEFDIPMAMRVDEILELEEAELIVNLTPPLAHKETSLKILRAGKHVFCEKPFALTVEDANEVIEVAQKNHLYIGAAPDTFLTAPMQSCRKLIEDGWIGKPLYVTMNMMSPGVEMWHPAPRAFYKKGGGPLYDMAGYYLSVLIMFFGAVEEVFAYSGKGYEVRKIYSQPLQGEEMEVEVPTHYMAVLKMKNGMIANMNMSFDVWHSTLPKMEIYGTEGTLMMPDPNMSAGKAKVFRREQVVSGAYGMGQDEGSYEMPLRDLTVSEYTRGTGVAEMVCAINSDRKNIANEEMAIHILEVIQGIMSSSESHCCYRMRTVYERSEEYENWNIFLS